MQVGILGAGNIGGNLASKLAAAGHEVVVGVRDPASPKAQAIQAAGVSIGTFAEAAQLGSVVVVALPLAAARDVLATLALADKTILDTTNAFGGLPDGFTSAGAAIQAWSGSRRLAKVFNATPWEALADPIYNGKRVETFICGDDAEAKVIAMQLARDVGFTAIDLGGLANAPLSENLARLWGTLAMQRGYGRNFAFTIVERG